MNQEYTIEFLQGKFKEHSDEFEKQYHQNPYKDENFEYFNLSKALYVISKEISELKNEA